jgi:DNA processing protein
MSATPAPAVCDACARRTWLLTRLAGHLETGRGQIMELLALGDADLIDAVAGVARDAVTRDLAAHDAVSAAAARRRARLEGICRCDPAYPGQLRDLPCPPAALHVAGGSARLGELAEAGMVAIVGARRATSYGLEMARVLGRDLAAAGLTVVSGLALGVDGAAHDGAVTGGGRTIAVLPGGADRAYPAAHARLLARVREQGVAISELGPGVGVRRWMFPARNRLIAALGAMTIVVQARGDSGALLTAAWARDLGRDLGAVPGQARSPLAAGPHDLIRDGATLVAGAGDVLDALYGAAAAPIRRRPDSDLDPPLGALLEAIADGEWGEAAFARAGLDVDGGLSALAALELRGLVRRGPGGRYGAVL